MKSLAFATWMAAMAVSTAFAQAPSPSSNAADRPINVKFQDIKWQKIMPEGSPEIVILHVDSQTQATQLMIRVPKNFHVARCAANCRSHWSIWVVGSLLLRLVWAVARGGADDVSKLLIGLAGLLGAPFLIWRTWIADRQRHIAQEELYTGLLVKAVEQLGATREEKTDSSGKIVSNTEVRLGAIYALEKLSRDYEPLHRQIMEILCAYVRKNAEPPRFCSAEIRAIYAKRRWHDETDDEKAALMAARA